MMQPEIFAPPGLQSTPKAVSKFRDTVTYAPCSLKQGAFAADALFRDEADSNTEVLNTCCGGFNSLLFLTPPKIRSTAGDVPTPSPGKQEGEPVLETTLSRDLDELLNGESEGERMAPKSGNDDALQNITNLEQQEPQTDGKRKAGKAQFKFPEGGWVCLACQNYNFCGRTRCNRCGKSKTKDDPVGKPKHLLKRENDENDPGQAAAGKSAGKGAKKQLRERAGDWLCLSCRNINFAFRQQCNRCKLSKELVGSALNPHGQTWEGMYPQQAYSAMPYEYTQYAMAMQQVAYPVGL